MSKPRKYEVIQCQYFRWRLTLRGGVFYADGRSNAPNPGRHSLNTQDREGARKKLVRLDQQRAVKLGLAKPQPHTAVPEQPLPLDDGRKRYEQHIQRPIVAGGVKQSTQKRYRAVFDKFLPFAKTQGIETWNSVSIGVLHAYASRLEKDGFAAKTIRNEMVTIAQAQKWLVKEKHLVGIEPLKLSLRKVESERPYCYTSEQVAAMIVHCRSDPKLIWLAHVIVGLATTGLRIAELAALKWTDINLNSGRLTLTDETGRAASKAKASGRRLLKSGRSRSLPIHPDLAAALNAVPRVDAFVFHGSRLGRLKPDTVRQCLIRDAIKPLAERFPSADGERGFCDARVHSFRHYFASACANSGVPERVTMAWLGHADSGMVAVYYHLHDQEGQRQMNRLDLLGEAGQQLPGVDGAATKKQETPGQEDNPDHRS